MTRLAARIGTRLAFLVGSLGMLLATLAPNVLGAAPHVVVLPTTGTVDNVMAGYIADAVRRAEGDGTALLVVKLTTPGGSLGATEDITKALLNARVPTAVWVAPSGGRAASAGTFITLSAALAVMAPGTNIGAASPVGGQGEDIPGTLGEKVKNDAIANISAIAKARGRNVAWAVSTVSEAKSYTADEAAAQGAIDGIAATIDELISFANGRTVTLPGARPVVLALTGAVIDERGMNAGQAFLHLLSDPNIAFLLFTIGFYGLLYEVINPNFVTGITGALSIILAFVGFGSLPLNVAGLLLLGLAIVLFVLETTVTSHGLLAVGGLICFVLGASALYTEPGDPFGPLVGVATPLIVVTSVTTAVFMALIVFIAVRTRRMTAGPGLVGVTLGTGTPGIVRRPLEPLGSVYAGGEEWTARAVNDLPLERGTLVKVVGVDGLTVLVEPESRQSVA